MPDATTTTAPDNPPDQPPRETIPRATIPKALWVFVPLYMLAFGALTLRQGNTEFLIYTISMLVFIAVVMGVHRTVRFSPLALWLLAIWGFLHMAGGTIPVPEHLAQTDSANPVLYALRPWSFLPRYDQITHAFGFFSATTACWEALRATVARYAPPDWSPGAGIATGAALMGVGLGATNEVLEFAVTLAVPDNGVGGYVNTGWDLVSNTIGAICAAALAIARSK